MAESLPFMKLMVGRFLGSSRVQALPGPRRWLYLGLLVHEWNFAGRGLPSDIGILARLLNMSDATFLKAWEPEEGQPGISQFFEERDGRLFNETCEAIFEECRGATSEAKFYGRLGAKKRWGANATLLASQPMPPQCHRASGDGDGSHPPKEEEDSSSARCDAVYGEFDQEVFEFLKRGLFGPEKARAIALEGRLKASSVPAWRDFLARFGRGETRTQVQNFADPSEIPPEILRNDRDRKSYDAEDREKRLEEVQRKREAARKAAESAQEVSAPPVDFVEAYKKLRRQA